MNPHLSKDSSAGPDRAEAGCCHGAHHHPHGIPPETHPEAKPFASAAYYCPMCPGVESDQPGDCPKCSMALERNSAAPLRGKTIFTCPMHPQIEQDHPGDCPLCGMALEPKTVSAGGTEDDNTELRTMTRRLWVSAALTTPIFLLAMAHLVPGFAHAANAPLSRWAQFLLSIPVVWWAGWPFFVRGARSIRSGHWNMFTLIALGVGSAWLYSAVAFRNFKVPHWVLPVRVGLANTLHPLPMRPLVLLLFSYSLQVYVVGQEIDSNMRQSMGFIVSQCAEIKQLQFPRPFGFDQDASNFERAAKIFERALENLRKRNPTAVDSPHLIGGKPFNAHVRDALLIIENNRKGLAADKLSKPDPSALAGVDSAINIVRNNRVSGDSLSHYSEIYSLYIRQLEAAKAIDPRALEARRSKLDEIEETFVKNYRAAKEADAKQIAAGEARKHEVATRARQNAQAAIERRKSEAKKLGYKDTVEGITNVMEQLRDGSLSLSDAKGLLIYHDPSDDFQVQSVVGSNVIYAYRHRRDSYQIAVVRERDGFYGEGAELVGDTYAIVGMQGVTSVLGAKKEILVLKRVP